MKKIYTIILLLAALAAGALEGLCPRCLASAGSSAGATEDAVAVAELARAGHAERAEAPSDLGHAPLAADEVPSKDPAAADFAPPARADRRELRITDAKRARKAGSIAALFRSGG